MDKRTIKAYEGLYEVDKMGNVYSFPKKIVRPQGNYVTNYKKLKPLKNIKNGYFSVHLYKNKKCKKFYVHRLIAEAFLNNPNKLKTVDHLDFDKSNNSVYNLEYCSQSDNYNRYINSDLHYKDGKLILDLNTGIYYKSISEASLYCGIERRTLSYRLQNKIISNLILA